MEKKRNPWEQAARKGILGEKHELKSLPGYWIKPRKYSIEGQDLIQAEAKSIGKKLPKSLLKKIAAAEKKGGKKLSGDQLLKALSEDEIQILLESQEGTLSKGFIRKSLQYGIGEHNLEGSDTSLCSSELAEKLIEYPDLSLEIFTVIQEHNRPLGKTTGQISGT